MTSPDQLSPVPEPSPEPARLPYGLTWADVGAGLGDFGGGRSAWVSHHKSGPHQGGHPSVIMTLEYDARDGPPSARTLFFKCNPDDAREAVRYRFLDERGIAVPRLVVCVERADEEVLGLEFVPSVGLAPADVDDLLRLIARLNAITDAPPAVAVLRPGMPQPEFERRLADALVVVAGAAPNLRPSTWLTPYRDAARVCRSLPRALTHGELAAQQVGRTGDGRLVVFDLATVGERARFTDLANVLRDLSRLSGEDERSVLDRYLHHLAAAGGSTCSPERSWEEVRITRFVQELEALPWRIGLDDAVDLRRHLEVIASDLAVVLAHD